MPRVILVVLLLGSAGLLLFSLARLNAAQRDASAIVAEVQKRTDAIDAINQRWDSQATSRVTRAYLQGRESLVQGEEAITRWLQRIRDQAKPLALEVQERFSQSIPHPTFKTNFVLMPVTLEIKPTAETAANGDTYKRLMALCQEISISPERVDWLELSVSGASNSVNRAVAGLQLWVGENLPE